MSQSHRLLILLVWLPVSCASDSGGDKPADDSYRPLSQRMEEKNGYKQDSQGNWMPQNDKRSSFDAQRQSNYFKGDYQKKGYQAESYAKKSWWGNKDYGTQPYAGNTDGSRFQKTSKDSGKGAREAGTAADIPTTYQTGRYDTHAARETGHRGYTNPSKALNDEGLKSYPSPEIIDWRAQRSLSLEQSKGLLGR